MVTNKRPERRRFFIEVTLAALSVGAPAWAQAPSGSLPSATTPASLDAGSGQLQEVVVTAQKRTERLIDVPMAVSVITAQSALNRGITNLEDLGSAVAGVEITNGGYAVEPAIRGVTSTNPNLENNVAIYMDGFYQDSVNLINSDLANLQSVQILKGPQGTLYGRNATGGAILYTTLAPSKTFTESGELGFGNYNSRSASGYISGPITDRLLFGAEVYGRKDDGYYALLDANGNKIGSAGGTASYSGRLKLQYQVTDDLKATLAFNYASLSDPRGLMFTDEANRFLLPTQVGKLYEPFTYATNEPLKELDTQYEQTLTLAYKTPIGTLTSYTGASQRNQVADYSFDASYANFTYINVKRLDQNFQENVDYDINSIKKLDLVVGGTYYLDVNRNTRIKIFSHGILSSNGPDSFYDDAWALYAKGSYEITDKLIASAGLRYSDEEKSESYQSILYPSGAYAAPPIFASHNKADFPNVSPQGSLRYKINQESEIYASITEGYRSGQVQVIATAGGNEFIPVKPEKITSYEIGYKLDNRQVQFTTAAYYYDYSNLQVADTIPNPLQPTSPISVVGNAEKATIYGVEADVVWSTPIKNLTFDASGSYIKATYTDFADATGEGLNFATGHNIGGQVQNWSGMTMPRAPSWSGTFAATYKIENVVGGSLLATGNTKLTTSYVTDNASLYGPLGPPGEQQKERYVQPGYALLNGTLTWTDASGHYHIALYAKNITDVHYHLDADGATFGDYNTWASPRTYGVRLGFKY